MFMQPNPYPEFMRDIDTAKVESANLVDWWSNIKNDKPVRGLNLQGEGCNFESTQQC